MSERSGRIRTNTTLTLTWLAYSVLVLLCAAHHEAWFDEAQAWLLARDSSLPDFFSKWLVHEVSPPLWHLILMPFAKLGMPYTDLSFLSCSFAILGVGLFLWKAPFPLWIRLLFPFGYFPLFQYSVVARNYVLFLPILCGAAMTFPKRHSTRRFWYLFSLFLLANISLHGTLIAVSLFVEWVWTARTFITHSPFARATAGALLVACVLLVSFSAPLRHYMPTLDANFDWSSAVHRSLGQVSESFFGGMGNSTYRVFRQIAAVLAFAISLVWFRKTSTVALYLGLLLPLLALAFIRASLWHSGLCLLVWIFALWISFQKFPERAQAAPWMQGLVAFVLAIQVLFGLNSWRFDLSHTYSGSKAAAHYLAVTGEDHLNIYALGFKSFAVQPYFHRNLFVRQEHSSPEAFCFWASDEYRLVRKVVAAKPDKILVGIGDSTGPPELAQLRLAGYCDEKRFDGGLWWKNGVAEPDSYQIMTPCPDRPRNSAALARLPSAPL